MNATAHVRMPNGEGFSRRYVAGDAGKAHCIAQATEYAQREGFESFEFTADITAGLPPMRIEVARLMQCRATDGGFYARVRYKGEEYTAYGETREVARELAFQLAYATA